MTKVGDVFKNVPAYKSEKQIGINQKRNLCSLEEVPGLKHFDPRVDLVKENIEESDDFSQQVNKDVNVAEAEKLVNEHLDKYESEPIILMGL